MGKRDLGDWLYPNSLLRATALANSNRPYPEPHCARIGARAGADDTQRNPDVYTCVSHRLCRATWRSVPGVAAGAPALNAMYRIQQGPIHPLHHADQ